MPLHPTLQALRPVSPRSFDPSPAQIIVAVPGEFTTMAGKRTREAQLAGATGVSFARGARGVT